MAHRQKVVCLYRKILRLSKTWEAVVASETKIEKDYIKKEAEQLFKANKNIEEDEKILECIKEGEARLEIAQHYRIPYPRPVNMPPNVWASKKGKFSKRSQKRIIQSKPIYVKSYDPS